MGSFVAFKSCVSFKTIKAEHVKIPLLLFIDKYFLHCNR